MSKREDDNVELIMQWHNTWENKMRQLAFDNLNTGVEAQPELLTYTAEELVADLEAFACDFDGSEADYDPENKVHHDYLLVWCKAWLVERGKSA